MLSTIACMFTKVSAADNIVISGEQSLNLVSKLDPNQLQSESLDETSSHFKTDDVTIPKSDDQNIVLNGENKVVISLPEELDSENGELVDDGVVYQDEDNQTIVQSLDGAVRQTFVIQNVDGEKTFTIDYSDTPGIGSLAFATDDEGNTDGSIQILNKNGDSIAASDTPWAKDAQGNDVKTFYEIDGLKLIQTVVPTSEAVYPIVADPTTFSTYFSSSKWIVRSGVRSLSLTPSTVTRLGGVISLGSITSVTKAFASNAVIKDSWNKLYNKYKGSSYWKNTDGMRDQYVCHFRFAFFKSEFNLEPSRPNVSFASTVASKCNP